MTSSVPTLSSSRCVSAPSPGPISTTKSSFERESESVRCARTRGSCRKCCPNLLRGTCELDRKVDRLDEARCIGLVLAGEVERRAVVDRSAHERQPERDVHA